MAIAEADWRAQLLLSEPYLDFKLMLQNHNYYKDGGLKQQKFFLSTPPSTSFLMSPVVLKIVTFHIGQLRSSTAIQFYFFQSTWQVFEFTSVE